MKAHVKQTADFRYVCFDKNNELADLTFLADTPFVVLSAQV